MSVRAPHFLLKAECHPDSQSGQWRFALQTADGRPQIDVEDAEPAVSGERLELLTVVRGLEAIDRPSHVTLITTSAYVCRGIEYGLDEWRANNWRWERHGAMVPVKNGDLWRRLDRAFQVHRVDCRPTTTDCIWENRHRISA
jgi:ribonuclease HI